MTRHFQRRQAGVEGRERLRQRVEKQNDMIEKALSLEAEREKERMWTKLKIDGAARFGMAAVLNGLVPLAVLLMEIGFLGVPYRYWARGNPEAWPVWVLALSLLFALALLPLLLVYARSAWRAVVK